MSENFRSQGARLLMDARRIGVTIHLLRSWKQVNDLVYGDTPDPSRAYVRLRHAEFGKLIVMMMLDGKFKIHGHQEFVPASNANLPAAPPRTIGAKELCKRFSFATMNRALLRVETSVGEQIISMKMALEQAADLNGVSAPAKAA